jgi:CBS domain containing-hemolysin-like protein
MTEFLNNPIFTPLLLALLVVISAFFSGSEIALVSISHAKIRAMQEKKLSGSGAIAKLKTNPNRSLITILIGNNLVNIGATALATLWATALFGSAAFGWVTGILTIAVLIFGEIFPKTIAQRHNERFARIAAPVLLALETIFLPIVLLTEILLNALMQKLGEAKSADVNALGELKAFIRIVGEKREIDANVQDILESAFDFDRTKVGEIMTPKDSVIGVDITDDVEKLRDLFVQRGRSRIVVFKDKKAIGIVNMHMLLEAQTLGAASVGDIRPLEPVRAEASSFIDDLLAKLQEANQQLALVYDRGEFVGVASVENVLEEIVGEMHDEKEPSFRRAVFDKKALVNVARQKRSE